MLNNLLTDVLKTALKGAIQKIAEATSDSLVMKALTELRSLKNFTIE